MPHPYTYIVNRGMEQQKKNFEIPKGPYAYYVITLGGAPIWTKFKTIMCRVIITSIDKMTTCYDHEQGLNAFLDAIASQEIPYKQATYLLT